MEISKHIKIIEQAHKNQYRRANITTPYIIHPIWCAMTLLHETNLDLKFKKKGYLALLYHDVLEDSNKKIKLSKEVGELVENMTFDSFSVERAELWSKSPEIKLLKLYDKVSNLMDGEWMDETKMKLYLKHTKRLIKEIKEVYGDLNIVIIAQKIIKSRGKQK